MLPLMMLLASAPAFAHGNGNDGDPAAGAERREKRLASMSAKLGLDAAGTEALRATFTRYQAQLAPLRKDSWQTRQALQQELANAQPDAARLTQLTDRLAGNRQKMASLVAQRQADLKQQLTPAQYAKLVLSHHGFGRGGGMHHRFRGGNDALSPPASIPAP
jgi:Spy/CpxP family protein refolding chaperone